MPPARSALRSGGSKRNLIAPLDARLSIIAEDSDVPVLPSPPPQTQHRPFGRVWGDPPRHSFEQSPPDYSPLVPTSATSEKIRRVRNNKYLMERGGLKRLCLIACLVIAVVVALAVGLALGLGRKANEYVVPAAS